MIFYSIIFGSTIIRFFEGNIIYYGKKHIINNKTVIINNARFIYYISKEIACKF